MTTVRTDPWQEDDHAWFAAHPERSFRLRRIYANEYPPEFFASTHVIVRQIKPGNRDKLPTFDNMGGQYLEAYPDDDASLLAAWLSIEKAPADEVVLLPGKKLRDQAAQLARFAQTMGGRPQ